MCGNLFIIKKSSFPFIFLMMLVAMASCNKRHADDHYYLIVENASEDTVYLADKIWMGGGGEPIKGIVSSRPKESCMVVPGINDCILPLREWLTYEYMFTKTTTYTVFVFPEYYNSKIEYNEYKMVRYDLTLKDLQTLDFHLYYPPNDKMSGIKMDPPYSSFEEKKEKGAY